MATVRLRFCEPEGLRIEEALLVGDALRRSVMGRAREFFGPQALPPELSGHGESAHGHAHAFWLSEPDAEGRITHALVHAPGGLGPQARQVLSSLDYMVFGGKGPLRLMLDDEDSPLLASAAVWKSLTPYLHPWFLKKRFGVMEQLRREWGERGQGLPELLEMEELPEVRFAQRHLGVRAFKRQRIEKGSAQPDKAGRFLRLRFAAPVQGPLCFGYGSHFGLGLFTGIAS